MRAPFLSWPRRQPTHASTTAGLLLARFRRRWLAAAIAGTVTVHATTVAPPTFDELVNESDYIVHARVSRVESRRETTAHGTLIFTYVAFTPLTAVAGSVPRHVTLRLLGGTVGDETLEVDGMPRFVVGDEEVLFVRDNGRSICPLNGMMFGRYRVRSPGGSGPPGIFRDDGSPLLHVTGVSHPLAHTAPTARIQALNGQPSAMTTAAFIAQIRAAATPESRLWRER